MVCVYISSNVGNKQYFDVSFLNLEQKERKIAHCLEIIFWIKLFWFMMMNLVNMKFKNLTSS